MELAEPSTLPTVTLLDENNYSLPLFLESIVMGWGSINNLDNHSDTLMAVSIPLLDNQACENRLVNGNVVGQGKILSSMLCAGGVNLGRDSCAGDSGGPLIIHDPLDDKIIQIGLVSYGHPSICGDLPGVYTRLSAFQTFIKSHVTEAEFKSLAPSVITCQTGITPHS